MHSRTGNYKDLTCKAKDLSSKAKAKDTKIVFKDSLKVICNDFLVVKVNCWSHALKGHSGAD